MPWHPQWPLYLIEAALLAAFMLSACASCVAMLHPASPLARRLPSPILRRAVIGAIMGATAILLISSPWGRRSGAHMNPAVTFAFMLLGKVAPLDAGFYTVFQCLGGIAGVAAARLIIGRAVAHPSVNFVATLPGIRGNLTAFIAELIISFILFASVLFVGESSHTKPYTPLVAGILVMIFITWEAPLSGMSMNPARTLGSAVWARTLRTVPLYFAAPPLGMAAAALLYSTLLGGPSVHGDTRDDHAHFPSTIQNRGYPRVIVGIQDRPEYPTS